jgi:hypothetical protein
LKSNTPYRPQKREFGKSLYGLADLAFWTYIIVNNNSS